MIAWAFSGQAVNLSDTKCLIDFGERRLQDHATEILMLANDNPTTWIIYNYLIREFGLFPVLLEPTTPRSVLFRNRVKKRGWLNAISQVAFIRSIRSFLNWKYKTRIREICLDAGMENARPITSAICDIPSVNSQECRDILATLAPKIIIVNGTRIIGKKTLQSTKASFINTHHGITPHYRGAHGAYWALFNNDRSNCGVTVHLVDAGIDTGNIIAQERIDPSGNDSFVTYPFLLTQKALPLLSKAIRDIKAGNLQTNPVNGVSEVWYHPGFFQYVAGWLRGVK
jgi:folate-dependent phosphoribosylglycinamide formyltransferase PurN